MAITRPSVTQLTTNLINQIESATGITVNNLQNNLIRILAKTFSGASYDIYGDVLFIARQYFVFYAEGAYLDQWGSLYGVTRQNATAAAGNITITGTTGETVPSGTLLACLAFYCNISSGCRGVLASDSVKRPPLIQVCALGIKYKILTGNK